MPIRFTMLPIVAVVALSAVGCRPTPTPPASGLSTAPAPVTAAPSVTAMPRLPLAPIETPRDPSGHIIQSTNPVTVALFRVRGMTPDTADCSTIGDPEYCRTQATRHGCAGDTWEGEPVAVPADLTFEEATGMTPGDNPMDADPVTGFYGWIAEPGCYFVVATDTTGKEHPSPIVGVVDVGGVKMDVTDLDHCWGKDRWGSDVAIVCH